MPGLPFPCLNTIQPIFGCDVHMSIPPTPMAPAPHVVVWSVGLSQSINFLGASSATSKASAPESGCDKPVQSGWGYNVGRTHDAGPHLGHIWPNALLPLIMLGSANKHEFGSGTVKVPGGHDTAVGVGYLFDLGLDCFDFPMPPTPSSWALTLANTVRAGFTWSDYLRGVVQVYVDTAITWLIAGALSFGRGAVTGSLRGGLRSALSKTAPGQNPLACTGRALVQELRNAVRSPSSSVREAYGLENLAAVFTGLGVGSPIGLSIATGAYGQSGAAGAIDSFINDLYRE
jgi:hypothetical protein